MTKEAIPEANGSGREWGPLMRLDGKRKGILRTHFKRGATKFISGILRSSLGGEKKL